MEKGQAVRAKGKDCLYLPSGNSNLEQKLLRIQLVTKTGSGALKAQACYQWQVLVIHNRNTDYWNSSGSKKGNYKEFVSCQPFYFNGRKEQLASFAGLSGLESIILLRSHVPKKTQ
ncbi:hypothetical protein Tco_0835224 [Tanacetum coccineum]